jgi:hypothetical protein
MKCEQPHKKAFESTCYQLDVDASLVTVCLHYPVKNILCRFFPTFICLIKMPLILFLRGEN